MNKDKAKIKIFKMVEKYYKKFHKKQPFIPGLSQINYGGITFDVEEMKYIVDVALSINLAHGYYSNLFEQKFTTFLEGNFSHVINYGGSLFVNSGSSANLLAFMALTSHTLGKYRIKRGDEVITVACCFPTTISPIIQYGAVPVFVDVDETLNVDVKQIEKALSPKTKAVVLTHTLGNPFNIEIVKNFCLKHKLWLIEDCCDALGATSGTDISLLSGCGKTNKRVGTFGDISTFSFYPAHHVTTGEGGMAYTSSPKLYKIMKSLRDWGRDCTCEPGFDNRCGNRFGGQHGRLPKGYDHKYVYSHFGYNLKATEMQAAIGCVQMDKLVNIINKRNYNYFFLNQEIQLQIKNSNKYFKTLYFSKKDNPSWFGYFLLIQDDAKFTRNEITQYLEKNKIQTRNLFSGNILLHPCISGLKKGSDYRVTGKLSMTNKITRDGFWIGVWPGLEREELLYIVQTIKNFIKTKEGELFE